MAPPCSSTAARKSWRERIRHFTPAWYTVIMGTGVLSTIAYNFPYGTGGTVLRAFFLFFFALNFVLFLLISGATIARYLLFPEVWDIMLVHPAQSMFLGAFPMGAATLINAGLITNQDSSLNWGGTTFLHILWGFWWLDVFVSLVVAFGAIYVMTTRQSHSIERMTAVWLLPVVTLIVASSTGGNLASALSAHNHTIALLTSASAIALLSIGLSLALMIITVYLLRLILYGPPDASLILSAFVTLGPLGQGGYSLLVNGRDMAAMLPTHLKLGAGFPDVVYAVCFCLAFILWSMGLAWATIGLLSIYARVGGTRTRIPFNIGYWGLIFPNGVYAMLSLQLAVVLDSPFFRVFGAAWSVWTFVLWLATMAQTVPAVVNGSIFKAPCLAEPERTGELPLSRIECADRKSAPHARMSPALTDGCRARNTT